MRARRGQSGQSLPLVLAVGALVALAGLAAGAMGAVLLARSAAQAAADLAAVSAARHLVRTLPLLAGGAPPPGPAAADLAAAAAPAARGAGAELVSIRVVGRGAAPGAVEVRVARSAPLGLRVHAVARAAPGVGGGGAGAQAAAWALSKLGIPYRWGGTTDAGYDCSGLTSEAWRSAGVPIGRTTWDQLALMEDISHLPDSALRPGDLLFPHAGHVAMYVGGGRIVEAPYTGAVVRTGSVLARDWPMRRRPRGLAAVGPAAGAAAVPAWVPTAYRDLVGHAAAGAGIAPGLLAALLRAESGFDPGVVSHAGAQGIAQLMPATAAGLGVRDPFDPGQAVPAAARLLAGHLRAFGSVELALAAYNAGPGAVRRHGGVPPFPETRAYVARVTAWAGDAGAPGAAGVVLVRVGEGLT